MHLQWFRVPEKIYCKKACLPFALEELRTAEGRERMLVLTGRNCQNQENFRFLTDKLQSLRFQYEIFEIEEKVNRTDAVCRTEATGERGICPAEMPAYVENISHAMEQFQPDCVLVFGGDAEILAAQHLWLHCAYLKQHRVYLVLVPCFVGMSSHVNYFMTDSTGEEKKFFFADMTVIDTDLMTGVPEEICCGVENALYQAINALDAARASDYTDGMAMQAVRLILEYLPAVLGHAENAYALEKLASAGTMAGIAFCNAKAAFSRNIGNHVRFAELTGMDAAVWTRELEAVFRLLHQTS